MSTSKRIAFAGIVTALGFAIAYLGNLISVMKFLAPVFAGFLLIFNREIIDIKSAVLTYVSTSILLFILAPSKLSGLAYAMIFGYYPFLQPSFCKIRLVVVRFIFKFMLFNTITLLGLTIGIKLFNFNIALEKYHDYMFLGIVLYNIFFAIYELFVFIANKKINSLNLDRIKKAIR